MAAHSAVSGGIRCKFKLIKDLIAILITCKNEENPIKNEGSSANKFPPIIRLLDFFRHSDNGSQLRNPWPNSAEFKTHLRFYGCPPYLQE